MSIAIMSQLFKAHLGSANRKMLAVRLADFADDEGKGIFPTISRLSVETELSERTVQRMLASFVDEGLLLVVKKGGNRPGEATRYDFNMPAINRLPLAKAVAEGCHGVTHDTVTPVSTATAMGDTDDNYGCHGDTQTVIEPPIEPLEREGAREEREEDRKELERRYKALEIGRHRNPWPNVLKSSTKWGFDQFVKLSPEDRLLAEERRDAYLAACPKVKSGERKGEADAAPLGVYLRDRKFIDVAAIVPKMSAPESVNVAPFGPQWAGLRTLALLNGPVAIAMPEDARQSARNMFETLSRTSKARAQAYLARKGIWWDGKDLVFPVDFEGTEHRRRLLETGYPEANRLNDLAAERGSEKAEAWCAVFSDLCEAVRVGCEMYGRWRDHYAAMNWPFVADPGSMRVVYFPKGGPEGLDEFETAARAAKAEERSVDDAA
ncbi:helix-turn-helix domain-containing protein [Ensifer sp. ENS08]|uniref:helix-turn-helix domain-containing protein n=1 Tax=Ensifer sp. ENS08 TaxID=2769273 RepID=UPI001783FC04|nr:helix-turn-helix domain-containing protein [Ensifer sp. ENS08]